MNINFRNTHFLRTLLLGLLSLNGNGRGICIRTYVYLSMYKINFGSYVRTAPFATVRKLECGTPTTSFSFVKKNDAPTLLQLVTYISYRTYVHCNVLLLFCNRYISKNIHRQLNCAHDDTLTP